MNRIFLFFLIIFLGFSYCFAQQQSNKKNTVNKLEMKIDKNEYWWGGLSSDGMRMPFRSETDLERNLYADNRGNQAQPLLISSKGRYIWSDKPFKYHFDKGRIIISDNFAKIENGQGGSNLKEVFQQVSRKYFPPQGKMPEALMFSHPQYNTWIELMYDQNEVDILAYAKGIIDNGYPPGVIMIDDNWQENYGVWEFSPRRFNDPAGMIKKLHDWGFKVVLWVCPFVSPDSETFRYLAREGLLLLDSARTKEVKWKHTQNNAAVVRWWNGASALLDLSNPKTRDWFVGQLNNLVETYGVDGFKLDGGDSYFYKNGLISFNESLPNEHTMHFAKIGLKFPLNEYRASWKLAGYPLAQRLSDKSHNWHDLHQLIPGIIAQGLMGYAFTCPDMIGGGQFHSFLNDAVIDEELVVRSAQVHALMPMMQFSVAPWRILSKDNQKICRDMARLHEKMGPEILEIARASAHSGEPIVRPLAYQYPDAGYEIIADQFFLGEKIMVTPVVNKNERSRSVIFPEGKWQGEDGSVVVGPQTLEIDVPLERLPWYRRIE